MSKEETNSLEEYARYKYVIENIKDVIWEVDKNLVFTFISTTIKGITGYATEEMIGRCILEFLAPKSKMHIQEQLETKALVKIVEKFGSAILYDVEFICKDGKTIWCEVCVKPVNRDSGSISYIGMTRDVSEKKLYENKLKAYLDELKYKNKQLEELLTLDMLTGAYNRRKFEYFVGLEIEERETYFSPFSIIMFDIDNFKEINDYFGHKKGDIILQNVTALVKNTLRENDKLFRWGGDEFIILLPRFSINNALVFAKKLKDAIELFDFDIEDKKVTISSGAGEYILPETQDQFVNRVDNALLKAKSKGKNNVVLG